MAYQDVHNDPLRTRKQVGVATEQVEGEQLASLQPPALQLAAGEGTGFQNRHAAAAPMPFEPRHLAASSVHLAPPPLQLTAEENGQSTAAPTTSPAPEPAPPSASPTPENASAAAAGGSEGTAENAAPAPADSAVPQEAGPTTDAAPSTGAAPAAAGGEVAPAEGETAASPETDPNFLAVEARTTAVAEQQQTHEPATQSADKAQSAAVSPASEATSKAQNNQMGEMQAAETPAFDAAAFKGKLMEQIRRAAPSNLQEADNFKSNNQLDSVKGNMKNEVEGEKQQSTGTLEQTSQQPPDTSSVTPRSETPLSPETAGPPPASVQADQAVPSPRSQSQVEQPLQDNSRSLDQQMADAEITESQLANSNEPAFQGALASKQQAQEHAATAPLATRTEEQAEIEAGKVDAEATAQGELSSMHGSRADLLAQVLTGQQATKSQDEAERARIASEIQGIYDQTKTEVEGILSQLDTDVETTFNQGAEAATKAFENYVGERMDAYKDRRYSGLIGKGRWVKDKLLGMPSEVNQFYEAGRDLYLQQMDGVIDQVVGIIGNGLTRAKEAVASGKQQVADYVAALPENLQGIGQEAASNIQSKFDTLESTIDSKQDELINTLAQKYNERLQAVDARIEEMKAANQGLVDKAINAVAGVITTILRLKNMLLGVLAKAAGVIGAILKDPIGFLGNLISGVKAGLSRFTGNIVNHLQSGLVGWLTGAMGGMGITIPEDIFSLKGIFSLVTQVLGLGWDFIRSKAVKLFGEKVVGAMEQGFEMFQILISEGIGGLWEFVKEKFGDLKAMVMDQIQDLLITQVITAGIKWLVGLLNPASAFVKAAMAIYDIVQFFITRGAQILDLVNAIIDSIAAVAGGNIGAMATKIEGALAKALPVAIGFLASLLGISGLADKVKGIVHKVRDKISSVVDGMLEGLRGVASRFMRFLGLGGKKDKKGDQDKKKDEQEDLKLELSMNGEQHTLYLDFGSGKPHVDMASKRGLLSNKIGRAVAGLIKRKENGDTDPKLPAQIGYLKSIGQQAKSVESKAIELQKHPEKEIKSVPGFDALKGLIEGYAKAYGAKDILDLLAEPASPETLQQKINRLLEKAVHTPPSQYSGGKHWRGSSEDERKESSASGTRSGQFLHGLSEAAVKNLEIETLRNPDRIKEKVGGVHAFKKFSTPIGYANGEEVYVLRAEMTGMDNVPTVHSHPRKS